MHQTIRKVNDAQRDNVTLTVPTAVLPATALALTKKTDAQECAYNLSNEALAKEYIKQAKALLPQVKDFLALDKEIGSRFRRLKKDETILGYKTLEELCRKELGIGARALQYRNAGGNPVSKRNKPKPRPLPLPPAPIERETVSSSLCDDSADLEQLLEDTAIRDYIDIRSEFYAWVLDHFEFDHDPCAPDGDGTMQFRRLWDALVDHPYDERTDIDADWLDVWWKDFHPRRKRNEAGELPPQPKMTLEEFVTRIFKEAKLPEEIGKNIAIGSPQSEVQVSADTTEHLDQSEIVSIETKGESTVTFPGVGDIISERIELMDEDGQAIGGFATKYFEVVSATTIDEAIGMDCIIKRPRKDQTAMGTKAGDIVLEFHVREVPPGALQDYVKKDE